jgi:hypothetical protein
LNLEAVVGVTNLQPWKTGDFVLPPCRITTRRPTARRPGAVSSEEKSPPLAPGGLQTSHRKPFSTEDRVPNSKASSS